LITVLIMAGGTGGHVFPALAVADILRERACRVVWLGTHRGIESRLVPAAGIDIEWIRVAGLRGKGLSTWLMAPVRLLRATWEALSAVRKVRPDVVLGLGGFVAGPGGVAARLMGLPLVIHEQNAIAGLTNRLLARLSHTVAEAFPGAFAPAFGAVAIGNPVRRSIEALGNLRAPEIQVRRRHLLVFGGSQGAAVLNRLLPLALAKIDPACRPTVLHQCGRDRQQAVEAAYQAAGVEVTVCEFIEDMAAAYHHADFVVSRSGALTVAELTAAGLPAILIPFPAAVEDHQTANARFLADRGAAILLQEAELTVEQLAKEIGRLCDPTSGPILKAMSESAQRAASPGAATRLADLCLGAVGAVR